MSSELPLLQQIILAARALNLDQAHLAQTAGVAPETISRAKKRGTIDLHTLQVLAKAVGLALTLSAPVGEVRPQARRSPLADPSLGLAWSNDAMSDEALVRSALMKGSYHLVLEAVMAHGLPFVRQQWDLLMSDPDMALSDRARSDVSRKLNNIERGLRLAAA